MNPSHSHHLVRSSLRSLVAGNNGNSSCRAVRHASRLTTTPASHSQPPKPFSPSNPHRLFTTTHHLQKKGGKAARDEAKNSSPSKNDSSAAAEDPNDFTALEAEITSSLTRLKDDLSKLRAGGRFNPDLISNLRVQPDKTSAQKVRLSDVAQVIPKSGRQLHILVGEKEHLKPVTSAIQSSSLSLTPQPDPTGANPLCLVVNIPPPTADSRKAAVTEAGKAGEKAGSAIKDARARQQKKLRGLQLSKAARPDELKKAGAAMEKVVEKGASEVKKVVDAAKKVLESA